MPATKPLPLKEFSKRDSDGVPRYNNLLLYFIEGGLNVEFRKQPRFIKFKEDCPDLERRLHEGIRVISPSKSPNISEELRPFDKDLYDFYLTMRSYGEPDENLIGRA